MTDEEVPIPIRAVVAGHASFAVGMIAAVDQITGRGSMFMPISNSDLCAGDIQEAISRAVDATGARVVFTDLPAGSCTMAVRRLLRGHPEVMLVTGCNVPMLLDFAMNDQGDAVESVRAMVERARGNITLHGPTP